MSHPEIHLQLKHFLFLVRLFYINHSIQDSDSLNDKNTAGSGEDRRGMEREGGRALLVHFCVYLDHLFIQVMVN